MITILINNKLCNHWYAYFAHIFYPNIVTAAKCAVQLPVVFPDSLLTVTSTAANLYKTIHTHKCMYVCLSHQYGAV